jgi:Domain of unknown function DUF29
MNEALLYETDLHAWALHNAHLLRQRKFVELDIDNVAEELEGMGVSYKHALENRLAVLIAHLLKWQFQPEYRGNSGRGTINEQRKRTYQLLKDSPSLKYQIEDKIIDAYDIAISSAAGETGLAENTFPAICPYSFTRLMEKDFYPD